MHRFDELDITPDTLNAIAAMGFEEPTAVQAQAIPPFLEGRDVLVQARTGTGKTASFGIPIVEDARRNGGRGVVALVLTPTRELALQVTESIHDLAKGSPLKAVTIYGGAGFEPQVRALRQKGPLVVVATPGRLLDHMERGTVRLDEVRIAVLDEADRMLDMGFLPDVKRILSRSPARGRQTGLYSATLPDAIRRISQGFMHDPVVLRIEAGPAVVANADQYRIDVVKEQKTSALMSLLQKEAPERALVFTRTKHKARQIAEKLDRAGHRAVSLQGNMSQSARERALGVFRDGRARILVATDVASRGLDVPEITHVINYDIPTEPEAYVHRVGRTARMGRSGRAFTMVEPGEMRDLGQIERTAGATLIRFDLPDIPTFATQVREGPRPPNRNGSGGGRNRRHGRRGGGRRKTGYNPRW